MQCQVVVSRRCMAYQLGYRRRGPDGRWAPVGVDEAVLKCVVKCGLLRQFELDKLGYFFGHWKKVMEPRKNMTEEMNGTGAGGTEQVRRWKSLNAIIHQRFQRDSKHFVSHYLVLGSPVSCAVSSLVTAGSILHLKTESEQS